MILLRLALIFACLLASCAVAIAAPRKAALSAREVSVPLNIRLREANLRFGFRLLSELTEEAQPREGNILISPLSVEIALGLLLPGASDPVRREIASTIEWRDQELDQASEALALLSEQFRTDEPRIQLTLANVLWAQGSAADLSQRFSGLALPRPGANVLIANLQNSTTAIDLNRQLSLGTSGQIDRVLDRERPQTRSRVLVNAATFRAPWRQAFNPVETSEVPFTLSDGKQKTVQRMGMTGSFRYFEGRDFQAVNLPFGRNSEWSMIVFLPAAGTTLTAFEDDLSDERWQLWMQQFALRDGAVYLPQLRLRYGSGLSRALKALGMVNAFSAGTSFPGLGTALDEVSHQTAFEAREDGLEPPLPTGDTKQRPLSIVNPAQSPSARSERRRRAPFVFNVDRPFFFAIYNNYSGFVLFLGSVVDPTETTNSG